MERHPIIGEIWKHRNGIHYRILHIANDLDTSAYPETIVFEGSNGKVWARHMNDWHRSMTFVKASENG